MTRHSIRTFLILALSVGMGVPATVSASPLLSGYGAPGAGDQAILGSALVGGSGAGGGGGGGSSTSGPGQSSGGAGVTSLVHTVNPAKHHAVGSHKNSSAGEANAGKSSDQARSTYRESTGSHATAALAADTDSGMLSLSAPDLLIMLMVAGGLVLVGGLTRRLARTSY